MNIVRYNEVDDSSYISNLDVVGANKHETIQNAVCCASGGNVSFNNGCLRFKRKTNDNLQTGGSASQKQIKKRLSVPQIIRNIRRLMIFGSRRICRIRTCCPSDMNRCLFVSGKRRRIRRSRQDNEQTVVTVYEVRVKESYSEQQAAEMCLK